MIRNLAVAAVCLTLLLLPIVAWAAATANFQGSCLAFSKNCDFNANLPAGNPSACSVGAFPTDYFWTFTNPSGTASGAQATHQFNSATATAKLDLLCSDGRDASLTRTICFGGGSGCIQPDIGYN